MLKKIFSLKDITLHFALHHRRILSKIGKDAEISLKNNLFGYITFLSNIDLQIDHNSFTLKEFMNIILIFPNIGVIHNLNFKVFDPGKKIKEG